MNFTKLEKRKIINPCTHIKILAYHGLIFKTKQQKQKIDKTKFSNKPPRATFCQLKEAKNPSKISLLLHTKPSKSIFKITSELSTTQERFLLQKLSINQKNCILFAYNKKVQSLSIASVTVSFNDGRRLPLNAPTSLNYCSRSSKKNQFSSLPIMPGFENQST